MCLVEIGQRPVLRCRQGRDAVSSTRLLSRALPRGSDSPQETASSFRPANLSALYSYGISVGLYLCRGGLWSYGISVRAIVIRHLCPGYIPTSFLSGLYLCLGGLWSYGISVRAIVIRHLCPGYISGWAMVIRHLCPGCSHTPSLSGLYLWVGYCHTASLSGL